MQYIPLRLLYITIIFTLVAVATIALLWEFFLEETIFEINSLGEGESTIEKFKNIITVVYFTFIAMIVPIIFGRRYINRYNEAFAKLARKNSELEKQVMELTRELETSQHDEVSSKPEHPAVYAKPFSLRMLIDEVVAATHDLVVLNENELIVPESSFDIEMVSDEIKLQQVLVNVVCNAARFTQDGCIGIEIESKQGDAAEWVQINITDTGIGLTEEEQENIFQAQPDYQMEQGANGMGPGLPVCRQFCRLMGGDIEVESQKDVGTTISINLPRVLGIEAT